jgi:hypothetical protein
MIASDPVKFFTEPHYNGYPAVLVRLDEVTVADLKPLIADAWRCQAPKDAAARPARRTKAKASAKTARASSRRKKA